MPLVSLDVANLGSVPTVSAPLPFLIPERAFCLISPFCKNPAQKMSRACAEGRISPSFSSFGEISAGIGTRAPSDFHRTGVVEWSWRAGLAALRLSLSLRAQNVPLLLMIWFALRNFYSFLRKSVRSPRERPRKPSHCFAKNHRNKRPLAPHAGERGLL